MDALLWIKFPEPTRDTFAWLWQDVVSLHFKWRLYLDLYGNPEAASVLDQTARGCFNLLAESLVNDIIMSFARLTDPAKTCGKDNLSIAHLLEVLSGHATPHYLGEWRTAAQLFHDRCGPFKQLRNKRIGHRDRAVVIRPAENPLPGVSRPCVEGALQALRDLMNAIEHCYRGSMTLYERSEANVEGEHLLFYLRRGIQWCREEEQRRLGWIP